ncbi:MAG: fructosamine kinase family protein [Chloroflexaceae bacterium]|jgi:fructosamine-3-kinase|nr:fructosamine kinase family protein [Chloroflexaceae bacterium]
MIPDGVLAQVKRALQCAGEVSSFRVVPTAVGGVSETARLQTNHGDYFLKWNATPWFGTFTTEAFHLSLLRTTNTVRVPAVIAFAESENEQPAWMLQEWIGGASADAEPQRLGARLGERIAALHHVTANISPGYGHPQHQRDGTVMLPHDDWATFLYEGHLRHHIERAQQDGRWTAQRHRRVEQLITRLPDLLGGVQRTPTLLHGDLHGGNVRCASNGEPVVADPWLFYGNRELELVSTLVSGDFLPAFYDAYQATLPLEQGFNDRVDLYKLVWYLSPGYYVADQPSEADNAVIDPILDRYLG